MGAKRGPLPQTADSACSCSPLPTCEQVCKLSGTFFCLRASLPSLSQWLTCWQLYFPSQTALLKLQSLEPTCLLDFFTWVSGDSRIATKAFLPAALPFSRAALAPSLRAPIWGLP